jgi:hypothetical protein
MDAWLMARKAVALAVFALTTAIGLLASTAAPAANTTCADTDTPAAQLSLDQFDASMPDQ